MSSCKLKKATKDARRIYINDYDTYIAFSAMVHGKSNADEKFSNIAFNGVLVEHRKDS